MSKEIIGDLRKTLKELKVQGTYKNEKIIVSPQGAKIRLENGKKVLNFCSNNYLGLANNFWLKLAAIWAILTRGLGLASVRFICGTQDIHKKLEKKISEFLGMEDTVLYSSCFDSNGGLFEPLLGENDAVITDELNHR